MSAPGRIAVAGLGNVLCSDDGLGVAAARLLAARRPDLEVHEVGVAILHGVELVAGAEVLILLDAMALGAAAGSLHRLDGPSLERLAGARSVHGLSLLQALAVSGVPAPPRVIAFGIEPAQLGYGPDLSPAVAAAMAPLLARVEQELADMALAVAS